MIMLMIWWFIFPISSHSSLERDETLSSKKSELQSGLWRKCFSACNLTSGFVRGSFYYINHCTFSLYIYGNVAELLYSVRSCDGDHYLFMLHFTISFLKNNLFFFLLISMKISCDKLTVNYFLFILVFLIAKHLTKRAWHRDPSKCQIGSLWKLINSLHVWYFPVMQTHRNAHCPKGIYLEE